MKKVLILTPLVLIFLVLVAGLFVINRIEDSRDYDELNEAVYGSAAPSASDFDGMATDMFLDLSGEPSSEDLAEFLDAIIFYSIRDNINEEYDPLNDECDSFECKNVTEIPMSRIDMVYATALEDEIDITISVKRDSMPSVATAIHLTFDYELNTDETTNPAMQFNLIDLHVGDEQVSLDHLDRILDLIDADDIEENIAFGTLDLEEQYYRFTLEDFTN